MTFLKVLDVMTLTVGSQFEVTDAGRCADVDRRLTRRDQETSGTVDVDSRARRVPTAGGLTLADGRR